MTVTAPSLTATSIDVPWTLRVMDGLLSQLKDNLQALESRDKLTPDVLGKIEEIIGNKPAGPARY